MCYIIDQNCCKYPQHLPKLLRQHEEINHMIIMLFLSHSPIILTLSPNANSEVSSQQKCFLAHGFHWLLELWTHWLVFCWVIFISSASDNISPFSIAYCILWFILTMQHLFSTCAVRKEIYYMSILEVFTDCHVIWQHFCFKCKWLIMLQSSLAEHYERAIPESHRDLTCLGIERIFHRMILNCFPLFFFLFPF